MPVFYFHPVNRIAQQLKEANNGDRGFMYQARGQLELTIQRLLSQSGYDIWPTFHSVIGSIGDVIARYIELNPDNPLDSHVLKLCKARTPWCWFKIVNGPQLQGVIGYCSTGSASPFMMTNAEMAQKGIIGATVVPRIMS